MPTALILCSCACQPAAAADEAKAGTATLPAEQMAALPLPGEVDFICGETHTAHCVLACLQ